MENNNQSLKIFNFEKKEVRTKINEDEIWFCLKDVADILEIANPHNLPNRIDNPDVCNMEVTSKTTNRSKFARNTQMMNFINESGLYQVIFMSRKPQAKKFKRWVTSEVLPTIRKTGSYNIKDVKAIVEWRNNRIQTKITRKNLTDRIEQFREYIKSKWDGDGKWYFVLITKAINKSLFRVDSLRKIHKNLRDEVDANQLTHISSLEDMLSNNLVILLEQELSPKEIYLKLKDICFKYANLLGVKEKPAYITIEEYIQCLAKKDRKLVNDYVEKEMINQKQVNQLELF